MKDIVRPQDCLLAVGFPLRVGKFIEELSDHSDKDFAKSIKRGFRLNEAGLRKKYEELIQIFEKNIDQLKRMGVTVITDFGLKDLPLIARYKVFTLATHWRNALALQSDIIDQSQIINRMTETPYMRKELPDFEADLNKKDGLVTMLNRLVNSKDLFRNQESRFTKEEIGFPDVYRHYLNRNVLDSVLDGGFRKGNRIELADGMHTIENFANAIPTDFKGVFDLTMCNSIMLQDEIKLLYPQCPVLGFTDAVGLGFKIIFYKGIILTLQQDEMPYIDAYIKLRNDFNS